VSRETSEQSRAVAHYRRAVAERQPLTTPAWHAELAQEAIDRFSELDFPKRSVEEWRYTNVSSIAEVPYSIASGQDLASLDGLGLAETGGDRLVFVDGRYSAPLSSRGEDTGYTFHSLAGGSASVSDRSRGAMARFGRIAEFKNDGLTALNTALGTDAGIIEIEKGSALPLPLHVVFVTTTDATIDQENPRVSSPRICLVAAEGSEGLVVQEHVSIGSGRAFSNAVLEVAVERDATLRMVIAQRESADVYHLHRQCIRQERSSRFSLHTLSLGGRLLRNDLSVVLADEGAECSLTGLYIGTGDQLVCNHTTVDHAQPHCQSHESYKGILADDARGVFRGRIIVRPDAQRTDADQQNRNLLLADSAEVDTQPQLEIYADDVKCNHGSSIGQLDQEALFFMRSRGLLESEARAMLTVGFAAEVTDSLPDARLADWGGDLVRTRLRELFSEASPQPARDDSK
jgi:Fe-S cluster assembly protein SufD